MDGQSEGSHGAIYPSSCTKKKTGLFFCDSRLFICGPSEDSPKLFELKETTNHSKTRRKQRRYKGLHPLSKYPTKGGPTVDWEGPYRERPQCIVGYLGSLSPQVQREAAVKPGLERQECAASSGQNKEISFEQLAPPTSSSSS